jgi:hypothetical protein
MFVVIHPYHKDSRPTFPKIILQLSISFTIYHGASSNFFINLSVLAETRSVFCTFCHLMDQMIFTAGLRCSLSTTHLNISRCRMSGGSESPPDHPFRFFINSVRYDQYTENLLLALLQLHSMSQNSQERRYFWIDALCS